MPAPLAVDWNEVRTLALAIGSADQAADHFQISREATRQRASREKWFVKQREVQAVVRTIKTEKSVKQGVSQTVTKAADALENIGPDTKAAFAQAALTVAKQAKDAPVTELLSQAESYSKWVGNAAKLHGWDAEGRAGSGQTVVNIAFLAPPSHEDAPGRVLIDVEGQDSGEQG